MNKKRALIVVFLAFVLTFVCAFAAACNKKNDDVKNVEVTAVTLNKETVELQLGVSTNITLTATVTPDNATDKTVTWTSSEQSVATVSSSGTVTAVAPGSTTITATAGGKSDTCVVVVRPAPVTVAVTGVSLDKTSVTLKMGEAESTTLTPTVLPSNATNKNVTWTSSNTEVATVAGGVVTALKAGTATITVTTADGNKTATCAVTVTAATVTPDPEPETVAVTGVTLNTNAVTLAPNGTASLTANVAPSNATNKTVTWTSSNTEVATVANGVVTAVAAGTATITVTTADGNKTATCTVTVTAPTPSDVQVTGVTLDQTAVTLKIGGTESTTLVATVSPSNATNKTVTWTSSNTAVATVANGVVTAVATGTATITVTTADGNKTATCVVTVQSADVTPDPEPTPDPTEPTVESVIVTSVNGATTVANGGSLQLNASVVGTNNPAQTVTWSIKSGATATGATVANGLLSAGTVAGTVTVVATSTVDNTIYGEITITVQAASTPDPTPSDYTADGTYTLDIAGGTATGIYIVDNAAGNGFATALDGSKYFKLSSSGSNYDCLYINVKLQKNKIITITGTARPSTSGRTATLGITPDTSSTGTVSGLGNVSISAEMALNQTYTVTQEGVIKIALKRASTTTGVEFLSFSVTISSPEPVNVESVSLDKTTSALKVGETETLTATVAPANADNTNVLWTSSDNIVATVDANGVVTAIKKGTVTITATAESDSTKKASCVYTISNVAPTSVTLNRTSAVVEIGDTVSLTATVLPANATIRTVSWTSSDETVATVDANGVVTAVAAGSVTITATATDDSNVKATCSIEVKTQIIDVTGISLDVTSVAKYVGDTLQLNATITPDNADDKSVEWSTSNASVATVSASGLVTIVGEGTVTITATSSISTIKATCVIDATYKTFTVTFMSDGTNAGEKVVRRGETTTALSLSKQGYTLKGWYESSSFSGTAFDFSTAITKDITLYALWEEAAFDITYSQGNLESAAIEWSETNAAGASVQYKLATAADSTYTTVDSELIRQVDADTARVDVLGLKGGVNYTFKITASSKGVATQTLAIKSYDRSGYAHYNRAREGFGVNTGVGAYNDDGTLKDNAIVIYVTDENKDTVMKDVVAKYSGVAGYEQLKMFQIPYCAASNVANKWNNKDADGIGWWLNNAQYTMNNANSSANKVPSNTYDESGNGGKLGFRGITNNPIVIRIIGKVETPEGCTAYNSEQEGGSNGDNGHMARMKNCQHITIEGVGEDAQIHGWGIHFMGGTDATGDQGMSFEVRNITFFEYPEDALGMEGVQDGTTITGPVERCWIHHNTFLPGHCANPAESDKAEGDGSCDFKRGQYLTCAYNWFEYCHKTNLVGSSDSSLQFNLTYHHNTWWQCGSRIPLARQANIHFYNNYVYGNQTETTTPYSWISKPALSYVHSLRANCYIYTENNYYDGCKNVTDGKNGGKAKGWNNIYFACSDANTVEEVTDREKTVSGTCSYATYDYSAFDTDPTLFYYDSVNKVSDCYMTDAATARAECLKYSGVLKRDYDAVDTSMIKERPSKALTVPSTGLTIDLTKATLGGEVDGVKFVNGKYGSGVVKGKDVLAVFTLAENTEVSINASAVEIANVNGEFIAHNTFSGSLDEGTYYIRSNVKSKEGTISSMSFKSGVTNEERVANVIALIDDIGTVTNTAECKAKIERAQSAYSALSASLQAQVTNASTLTAKANEYNALVAAPVIELINAIGTVDANSGTKITAARNAYSALTAEQKALVTNYNVLVAAEEAYVAYEVEGINNAIAALADPATATTEEAITSLLEEYNNVKSMYEGLSDEQKTQVTNYSKVTSGIATLTAASAPYDVKAQIAALPAAADVTRADATAITAARTAYDALTADQKTVVGDITKLTAAEAALAELSAGTEYIIFAQNAVSAGASVTGNYKTGLAAYTVDGQSYTTAVKMESSTSVTFTTTATANVTLVFHSTTSGAKVKIDGTSYTIGSDKTVVLENLAAGSHTITKGDTNVFLCYAMVES